MRRLRGGFTLIELLVVVAIIALLISILLPALSEAKKRAQETVCASNLRQMHLAMRHYLDDNNGFYPGDHKETGGANGSWISWAPRIRKYINGDMGIFWCPSTDINTRWQKLEGGARPPFERRFYGYEPGERLLRGDGSFSYGYNGWGVRDFTSPQFGLGGHTEEFTPRNFAEINESKIKRPSDMIAIADSNGDLFWDAWISPQYNRTRPFYPSKRHRGGAEVLFADGHAVNIHFEEVIGLRNTGPKVRSEVAMRRWNNDNKPHEEYWGRWPRYP